MFYACESENALLRAAGEQCARAMSDYLGPNIFRGRVEQAAIELVAVTRLPFQVLWRIWLDQRTFAEAVSSSPVESWSCL